MCACHVMIKRVKGRGFVLWVHETILTTTSSNRSASSHSTSSTLKAKKAWFCDCSTVECDETQHTLKLIQRCH